MAIDFYKILRVTPSASLAEIKAAYRKRALELHPDKHDGCREKLGQFQQLNEAYSVLSDVNKRRQYDFKSGRSYNKNRSTPPPPNYRTVYASQPPPPHWTHLWDEAYHYEMHYGDGFRKQAEKQALKNEPAYQSVLGKGFTFSDKDKTMNRNPYSTAPQGPPKIEIRMEENNFFTAEGKEALHRRKQIVRDLYERSAERQRKANRSPPPPTGPTAMQMRYAGATAESHRKSNDCVIL